MNWLTIGVILWIILMTAIGAKRGLVRTVLSFTAFLLALVIVAFVREPVANALKEHTAIHDSIEKGIGEFVEGSLNSAAGQSGAGTGKEVIDALPLPQLLRESLAENDSSEVYLELGVSSVSDYVVQWLTELAFQAVTYLITFLAAWILLKILSLVLDQLTHLPVIHQLNSLAGAVFGLLIALIIVWIGGLVVTAFASSQWGIEALAMIQESPLLSFLYNNNILMNGLIRAAGNL